MHQSISDELEPREVGSVSGHCCCMASTVHNKVLQLWMQKTNSVYRQWFVIVFPSPSGDIHSKSMLVFNAVPSKAFEVTGIQLQFSGFYFLFVVVFTRTNEKTHFSIYLNL